MTKDAKLFLTLVGLAVALVFGLVVFLWLSEWPGGMRSNYPAADYDPRLTRAAATGTPLITALERYHDEHSDFPEHAADLVPYLSTPPADPVPPDSPYILDWHYYQFEKSGGYVLSYKLGWDASLKYYSDGSGTRWEFNPGDGSPSKTIILKP